MSTTQFNSTSFFLSQWADNETVSKQHTRETRVELDIVEDPNVREVCSGSRCNLYYDESKSDYITAGGCERSTLCTESRIIKDKLYIKEGNVSPTLDCLNYDKQLQNWE